MKAKYQKGIWEIYHDSTQKIRIAWYKYEDGYFFDDSIWYRSGQLKKYWLSKEHTAMACYELKSWYPDGRLKCETYCDGDSSKQTHYYHSGQIKQVSKAHKEVSTGWMTDHYLVEFYENGQKKYDPYNFNGRRTNSRSYFENGKLRAEVIVGQDSTIGNSKEWYENGKLKAAGQYSFPPNSRNMPAVIKIGTWSYYNESGKLIKEEFYEAGVLVKTIEY